MSKAYMKPRSGTIAALDVGTTKTCCLIARAEGGVARIVGVGQHASKGVKAGTVVDMDLAEQSIVSAVNAAEEMAGETIQSVVVNVSGGQPASHTATHEIPVTGHEIADNDMRKVLDQARAATKPADRHVLHTIPVGYSIDGSRGIRDPRGMFGERLGVHVHTVSASVGALKTLATCIARCHLNIESLVVSPYAAGRAALVEDERNLGVTLIDMGGGTTTIAVFADGHLTYTDSVPIGGAHVTNDIARGLSTPLAHAERMKTLYGSALVASSDEREMIEVPLVGEESPTQMSHVPKSILTGIIQPRLEETFELVRSRLEASGVDRHAGRVVLTGGGAQLGGVRDLAALILDRQVRIGRPAGFVNLPEAMASAAFATSAGLLAHALQPVAEPLRQTRAEAAPSGGLFGRLGLWLKENF